MAHQLVLAIFPNEVAADDAVTQLKAWDKANDDIKLGAIGVLVKNEKGEIKQHKLGKRHTKTGALVFGLAGLLSGGMTVLGGAVFGGVLGSFFRTGLGMSKEDLARLDDDLNGGKAAVAVLAEPDEAPAVWDKLAELGGAPEVHEVAAGVVEGATAVAAEAPAVAEEAPAAPDAAEPEQPAAA